MGNVVATMNLGLCFLIYRADAHRGIDPKVLLASDAKWSDIDGEDNRIEAQLEAMGLVVTRMSSFATGTLGSQLASYTKFILPETETGKFSDYIDSSDYSDSAAWIRAGGAFIGTNRHDPILIFNNMFGWTITPSSGTGATTATKDSHVLKGGPSSLTALSDTDSVVMSTLPADAICVYSSGSLCWVFVVPVGEGVVGYAGWDWCGTDSGWTEVLKLMMETNFQTGYYISPLDWAIPNRGHLMYRNTADARDGHVCFDNFDMDSAVLACETFGYTGVSSFSSSTPVGLEIVVDPIDCWDDHVDFQDCIANPPHGSCVDNAILLDCTTGMPTLTPTTTMPSRTPSMSPTACQPYVDVLLDELLVKYSELAVKESELAVKDSELTTCEFSTFERYPGWTPLISIDPASSVPQNSWVGWYDNLVYREAYANKSASYFETEITQLSISIGKELIITDEFSPTTFLNKILSYGINVTTGNTGDYTWNYGHGSIPLVYRSDTTQFTSSSLVIGQGDGASDAGDWGLIIVDSTGCSSDLAGGDCKDIGGEAHGSDAFERGAPWDSTITILGRVA